MSTADFIGVPYPITDHARGFFHTQSGINQVKSDLLSLILTNQGERVMLPNFGVSLRRFLFEPNDAILQQQVQNSIAQQITLWEPRVVIQSINVTTTPPANQINDGHSLYINIQFIDPESISQVENLVLEVPIGT